MQSHYVEALIFPELRMQRRNCKINPKLRFLVQVGNPPKLKASAKAAQHRYLMLRVLGS